jgi:hypothetical protein
MLKPKDSYKDDEQLKREVIYYIKIYRNLVKAIHFLLLSFVGGQI